MSTSTTPSAPNPIDPYLLALITSIIKTSTATTSVLHESTSESTKSTTTVKLRLDKGTFLVKQSTVPQSLKLDLLTLLWHNMPEFQIKASMDALNEQEPFKAYAVAVGDPVNGLVDALGGGIKAPGLLEGGWEQTYRLAHRTIKKMGVMLTLDDIADLEEKTVIFPQPGGMDFIFPYGGKESDVVKLREIMHKKAWVKDGGKEVKDVVGMVVV